MSTLMTTLSDSLASDTASLISRVKVMTAYTITVDIGSALGPLLGYFIIDWIGIYYLYWMVSSLLFFLALVWYVFIVKIPSK